MPAMHTESRSVDALGIRVGDALPEREWCVDTVQLFLYNAVLFNAHRIHYDHPYATQVEGYPALVLAGPLLGDWLNQCVEEWLGARGRLCAIEYSNRQASYVGETLYAGGRVREVDSAARTARLEVFIRNAAGDVVTPGTATVVLY
jgi:hydroxyacyl-ACP dehydratase HTD2-like protein with hotdog domain